MLTEVSSKDWRELLGLALAVDAMAPWRWLTDAQVFAIHPLDMPEPVYCSVMGQEDGIKGLALYPGRLGWRTYLRIGQTTGDEDPLEALCQDRCLLLQLVPVAEAEQDDLALLRSIGMEAGAVVPAFSSYVPGYVPQAPDAEEMAWLLPVMREVVTMIGELPGSGEVIPESGQNDLGRVLVRKQGESEWRMDWVLPGPVHDFTPKTVRITSAEEAGLRGLPMVQEVWLFEDLHLPEPSEDGSGRAFFARAVVLLGLEDQRFRGIDLLRPSEFPELLGSKLTRMLLEIGELPANLVVSRSENLVLMRPFCQALGTGIHLEPEMDIRPSLREAIMEMGG